MEISKMSNKGLAIDKYGETPQMKQINLGPLTGSEILVKVMCTTIHPSDLFFINGVYGEHLPDEFPIVPGFEGSGQIIAVGPKVSKDLIGKRVCVTCSSNKKGNFKGLWSEYIKVPVSSAIIFNSPIDYERICFALVNPLTALGFLDTVKQHKSEVVIQTGASSAFGKMFLRLCCREGIKVINIVRRTEHFDTLKSLGAEYYISTSSPTWKKDLKSMCRELKPKLAFDCVGGNLTGELLNLMPKNSTLYHFGNMANKPCGKFETGDFLFYGKEVKGWWLIKWIMSRSKQELKYYYSYIIKSLEENDSIFDTKINKSFALKDFELAKQEAITKGHLGKVILRPHF